RLETGQNRNSGYECSAERQIVGSSLGLQEWELWHGMKPSNLRSDLARPVLRDADVRSAYLLGDIRTFLPYLVSLGLIGLGTGALVGLAGSLTGLRAPWWMLLVGPA